MIFGKYQLLDLIGRGGMAEVFKAKSYGVEGFEKLLVIKRILPSLTDSERFVEMFINEAKIAVSLNHANIVQVFDLGKVSDTYFIAMEYVQGLDLSRLLKVARNGENGLPPALAAFICSEAAKGLDYAHRRRDQRMEPLNIVHRDISPQNILISFEGEVKVTDFGIALAKTSLADDEEGVVKGKNSYMAPEQARSQPHDRRVDIFSLGVVLYELAAGINPLKTGTSAERLRAVRNKSFPSLAELPDKDISAELSDIVTKAMSYDPAERFQNAGELYEALIAYLYNTGERVSAHTLTTYVEGLFESQGLRADGLLSDDKIRESFELAATGSSLQPAGTPASSDDDITAVQVPTSADETTASSMRALAAEMRESTFLVVDFSGPTPPDSVIDRFVNLIQFNGGRIVEKNPDIIVSIFGLTVSDGRDTEDALDTALKVQQSAFLQHENLGSLQIGVGIHPKKIVLLSDDKPRQDDIFFEGVTIAREVSKQSAGWVAASQTGKRLARDLFRFEEIQDSHVNGRPVFKVIGRKALTETYGQLFGRREELRQIGEILAQVSRGEGRVLSIFGELGMGKTRIMHEVRRRLESGGHDVSWHDALCMPWRQSLPFADIAAMFRSILGVGEIEPPGELRSRVLRLRELGLIPEEVNAVSSLLGLPAGEDQSPDETRRQLRAALIRAATSLSSDKLTILFWDDLHYIDRESLDILLHLCKSVRQMPVLIVVSHSPNFAHALGNEDGFTEIPISPLSENDTKRLSRSRLNSPAVPEALQMEIALKSGGNPLYVEEYIKALIANDVVRIVGGRLIFDQQAALTELPKTLQGLVGDRIKRLPVDHRSLLQRASVIGQHFNIELLAHIMGVDQNELRPILINLLGKGMIHRMAALEFTFASDLIRDVALSSIVAVDIREIHLAIARSIEELYEDQIDLHVEQLAHHFLEGGDRKKAEEYLVHAGAKVALHHSHQTALDYYLKALDLVAGVPEPDGERLIQLYIPIGELAIKSNRLKLGLDKLTNAEELAEQLGDTRAQVTIMRYLAELNSQISNFDEAQQYFQRAIELADRYENQALRCEVRVTAGKVHQFLGNMKKSAHYIREAIDLWPEDGNRNMLILTTAHLAKSEAGSAELDAAYQTIDRAESLLDEMTDPSTRCDYERARAHVYYMDRKLEKSIFHGNKALEIAKEYDFKDQIAANAHNLGDSYMALGDYRKAFTHLRYSNETAQEVGLDVIINVNNIFLSFIDALKFGSTDGLSRLEKALELANLSNTVWEQVQVHYFLGRIYFERRQYSDARSHLEQALRVGRSAENKIYDAQAVDLLDQIREIESGDRD